MRCFPRIDCLSLFIFIFISCFGFELFAQKDSMTSWSLQIKAFAPNAGGQDAYALRWASDSKEWMLFTNLDLYAGDFPLMGLAHGWRHSFCGLKCPINPYLQAGLGLSSAGPFAEFIWGMNLLYLIRLDFSSHFILQRRLLSWGYPLWVGVSVPIW